MDNCFFLQTVDSDDNALLSMLTDKYIVYYLDINNE